MNVHDTLHMKKDVHLGNCEEIELCLSIGNGIVFSFLVLRMERRNLILNLPENVNF